MALQGRFHLQCVVSGDTAAAEGATVHCAGVQALPLDRVGVCGKQFQLDAVSAAAEGVDSAVPTAAAAVTERASALLPALLDGNSAGCVVIAPSGPAADACLLGGFARALARGASSLSVHHPAPLQSVPAPSFSDGVAASVLGSLLARLHTQSHRFKWDCTLSVVAVVRAWPSSMRCASPQLTARARRTHGPVVGCAPLLRP